MTDRFSHIEWTTAQCKGVVKDIYNKLHFPEKRADAMQGDSTDQVRHLFQAWEEGEFAEAARHILRECVRTGERQAGVGIWCCPCWSAAKTLDLYLAVKDQLWMRAEAARREAEEAAGEAAAAPAQEQMSAPASSSSAPAAPAAATDQTQAAAPDQTQAEILQMLARIFQAVRPGHAHDQ